MRNIIVGAGIMLTGVLIGGALGFVAGVAASIPKGEMPSGNMGE